MLMMRFRAAEFVQSLGHRAFGGEERARACGAPKRRPTAQKQAQLMLMMRASVPLNLSNHWGTGLLGVKKELEPAEPQNAGRLPKSRPS